MTLGYYVKYWSTDKNSYNSLNSYSTYMSDYSMTTFSIDADGTVKGEHVSDALQLGQSKGVGAYAAIQNLGNGHFDPALASSILRNGELRKKAAANMAAFAVTHGFKGINLDFENMYAADRPYYSLLVKELAAELHAVQKKLIVSVSAKTSDSLTAAWTGAFDYAEIGKYTDYLQLMTYDQHGPWGAAGPVAGLNWVENVVKYTLSLVPASKVLLGLNAYGYDWNQSTGVGNKAVSWKAMPTLIANTGATPQWDTISQSPYLYYTAADGSKRMVWYENEKSIQLKTKLTVTYQLAGVAMWRMGLEDEKFWTAVKAGYGN
nr:glycosyl hydrolase family 18 protein [Paenibacillus turpanensis]